MSGENATETNGLPTVPLVVQTMFNLPLPGTRHDVPNPAMIAVRRTKGGNGNLTARTQFVDATGTRDRLTTFDYDWRDRQTNLDNAQENLHLVSTLDNLDRQIVSEQTDNSGASPVLIGKSTTSYDPRGQVYLRQRFAVDMTTHAAGLALNDNFWYDPAGNQVKSQLAGSAAYSKTYGIRYGGQHAFPASKISCELHWPVALRRTAPI